MSKIEHRPIRHAVKTVWGWSHSQTGEQLVSAHGYFEGQYEADGGAKPNQGNPLVEGVSPEPETEPVSGNPKIDTQPADLIFDTHASMEFSVMASIIDPQPGDTLSYQWQIKKTSDSSYKNISIDDALFQGTTTNKMSTANAPDDTYFNARFRCIVSVGENSVTSTPATMTKMA